MVNPIISTICIGVSNSYAKLIVMFLCPYVIQSGSTPLFLAVMCGRQDIVDILLSNGARTVNKVRYFIIYI